VTVRVLLMLAVVRHARPSGRRLGSRASASRGGRSDGLQWMTRETPGDRLLVEWLRRHAAPAAVIAEATGNPYTDYRGSASRPGDRPFSAGRNHEGLWRAEAGEGGDPRATDRPEAPLHLLGRPMVIDIVRRRRSTTSSGAPSKQKDFGALGFPAGRLPARVFQDGGGAIFEPMQ